MTTGQRAPVLLGPGEGRHYEMGRLRATFKADEAETEARYSISEWWLDPHTKGPGGHSHPEDDVFYILEGTMTMCVGDDWMEAPKDRSCWCRGARPTRSTTAATRPPACSTSPAPGRSSRTCRESPSGSASAHRRTPPPRRAIGAIDTTAVRRAVGVRLPAACAPPNAPDAHRRRPRAPRTDSATAPRATAG